MISAEQQQKLLEFFAQHPTAVIATADTENTPAAAVVLFVVEDNLSFLFGTHPTRKYRNLKMNPKVAFVVASGYASAQLHGLAVELSGDDLAQAGKIFIAKHPEMNKHMLEGTVFFRFSPTWVRFTNNGAQPPEVWETEFSPT